MLKKNTHNLRSLLNSITRGYYFKASLCGYLKVPPNWGFNNRYIEDYHLLYVCAGSGTYWIDDQEVHLTPGTSIFLGPGVAYSARRGEGDLQIIPLRFSSINRKINEPENLLEGPCYGVIVHEDHHFWLRRSTELHRIYNSALHHFKDEQFSASLFSYLVDLTEAFEPVAPQLEGALGLKRVRSFMLQNPLDRSSTEDLAQMARLSPKYFTRQFKLMIGRSPKQFQVDCRLEHGKFLLEETALNVQQVARELGYPDPFIFSKQYKVRFGFSPKDSKEGK